MWLVRLAIYRPVTMIMIEIFLLVLGMFGFMKIGLDLFPKIDPPVITIFTEYPGAGPREVESLVSKVIEEEVNQIGGIERLISFSRENISRVIVEFTLETDARMAQIEVQNKIARIKNKLPKETEEPLIQRLDFADKPILKIAVTPNHETMSEFTSNHELHKRSLFLTREYADNSLKNKLQQIQGVGEVAIYGGYEREILIELDPEKLKLNSLSAIDVIQAIEVSNLNSPAGKILGLNQEKTIRVLGEIKKAKGLENVLVKSAANGHRIILKDVAKVFDNFKELESISKLNGKESIVLEIKKQSGANTVSVSDLVREYLDDISKQNNKFSFPILYDGSRQIKMSLLDVVESLVVAALLAFLVVYFFLSSIESTLITGIALPCTVIVTLFFLYIFGFTLNTMTLLGITLAVGLILDDAIVVRENIWSKLEHGLSPIQAAEQGSAQVYKAVLATSLTVLATFLPVAFIPGIVGRFFAAFALTVCIGVIISTFDALTMAPLLSAHLTKPINPHKRKNLLLRVFESLWNSCEKYYALILSYSLRNPFKILIASLFLFITSIFIAKHIQFTFLGASENGELEIGVEAPPGTRIEYMEQLVQEIDEHVRKHPAVDYATSRIGNEYNEANIASIYVRLKNRADRKESTSQMKSFFRKYFTPYNAIHKLDMTVQDPGGGGGGKSISMAISGPDTDVIQKTADTIIEKAKETVAGAINLKSNMRPGKQEIQLMIQHEKAANLGVKTKDVAFNLRTLYEGNKAGVLREGGQEYDIRVKFPIEKRTDQAGLLTTEFLSDQGNTVPINKIVQPQINQSPLSIVRIDQMRSALIEGDLQEGFALGPTLEQMKNIANPLLEDGYFVKFQGQAKSMKDLGFGMMMSLFLGALFVYMIMASLYESFSTPFAILLTLPLAIIGAILALIITGKFMDVYTVIGLILLMGLVTKNAILILDYVEQLKSENLNTLDALMQAGIRRLRPIMMTTIAMIAGMIPIAFGMSELNQARTGMGIACIGGLISSTLLSLIVVPCAYLALEKIRTQIQRFSMAGFRSKLVEVLKLN